MSRQADADVGETSVGGAGRRWLLAVEALALVVVIAGLFAMIQFANRALFDADAYYHAKMGYLIAHVGFTPHFIWLPMSILNPRDYVDHHFLYHVYLSLFVSGGAGADRPSILGMKIASVVMPTLAFLSIWWLLRRQRVRYAWLWTLALFALSDPFLYRMTMAGAQSAALLVMVLGLHLLLTRRYRWLLPLGFVFVWLYNAFPLLLMEVAVYAAATYVTEGRLEWQPVAAAALGIALGLVINLYFPKNIAFLGEHILAKVEPFQAEVGGEWYPLDLNLFLATSPGSLAISVLGLAALAFNKKLNDRATLTVLVIAILLAGMMFKSRRFIEYFPAFALIFGALSLSPLLDSLAQRIPRWLIPIGLAAILAFPMVRSVSRARDLAAAPPPPNQYATAASWLGENTPPGSIVFQTTWDDFPRLFFFDSSNVYTIGLDPSFMQMYDPSLYQEWLAISNGQVEHPSEEIAKRFGASYVFVGLDDGYFLQVAARDPGLEQIYLDESAVIYKVVP